MILLFNVLLVYFSVHNLSCGPGTFQHEAGGHVRTYSLIDLYTEHFFYILHYLMFSNLQPLASSTVELDVKTSLLVINLHVPFHFYRYQLCVKQPASCQ
jgi:hypothetical protein